MAIATSAGEPPAVGSQDTEVPLMMSCALWRIRGRAARVPGGEGGL